MLTVGSVLSAWKPQAAVAESGSCEWKDSQFIQACVEGTVRSPKNEDWEESTGPRKCTSTVHWERQALEVWDLCLTVSQTRVLGRATEKGFWEISGGASNLQGRNGSSPVALGPGEKNISLFPFIILFLSFLLDTVGVLRNMTEATEKQTLPSWCSYSGRKLGVWMTSVSTYKIFNITSYCRIIVVSKHCWVSKRPYLT